MSNIRTYEYCGLKIMKVLELWYAAEFADISGVARTASSLRSASGSSCGLRPQGSSHQGVQPDQRDPRILTLPHLPPDANGPSPPASR